jgi:hypothetical protein
LPVWTSDVRPTAIQVRHAKRGDEANLAFLLEDHERHYGNAVPDGTGAAGAAFLVDPPPNATLCPWWPTGTTAWWASPSSTIFPGTQP